MQPQKIIQPTIKVDITVDELANWFWGLTVADKVEFFNSLAEQERDWFGSDATGRTQLGDVRNHPYLTPHAAEIIDALKH